MKHRHIHPATKSACMGAEASAHKEAKGRPGEPKQVHTSPVTQRASSGAGGKPTQVTVRQKAQEKVHTSTYLASFNQQHKAGQGNRNITA